MYADDTKGGQSLRAQWTPHGRLAQYFKPVVVNSPYNFHNRTLKVGVVQVGILIRPELSYQRRMYMQGIYISFAGMFDRLT